MTLETITEYQFKGHTHIRIKGDCYTPPRGWSITLLTNDEFNTHPAKHTFRKIKPEDEYVLNMYFS